MDAARRRTGSASAGGVGVGGRRIAGVKLSTRGDYAVRVVLELTEAGAATTLSAHELGERTGVSEKYLTLLMRELQTKGIVRSTRGAGGGFTLGKAPEEITVGDVVRVMDGPLAPIACASVTAHVPCPTYRCQTETTCVLRDMWSDVRNAIAAVVDKTTFADLAERRRAQYAGVSEAGSYTI